MVMLMAFFQAHLMTWLFRQGSGPGPDGEVIVSNEVIGIISDPGYWDTSL